MKITKTKIDGVLMLEPQFFQDERGSFYELWRENSYKKVPIEEEFVQDNISTSKKDVLRGLHYQYGKEAQGQLVSILKGEIYDVCVDIRPDSKTFGQFVSFSLTEKAPTQIYMPPGIAHGFCVLSASATLSYKCTKYYSPDSEGGILWNDIDLSIPWPTQNPILSNKDLKNITFNEYRRIN